MTDKMQIEFLNIVLYWLFKFLIILEKLSLLSLALQIDSKRVGRSE